MISINFFRNSNKLSGFEVSGHAGYAKCGSDIVCASVTSAVQLVCNGVTEILGENANVKADDNLVSLMLSPENSTTAEVLLESLLLHINILAEDYPKNLKITVLEV